MVRPRALGAVRARPAHLVGALSAKARARHRDRVRIRLAARLRAPAALPGGDAVSYGLLARDAARWIAGALQGALALAGTRASRGNHFDPVPARLLGGVERAVGGANQSVDGAPVIRILRNPDRQRDARQRQAAARVLGVLDAVADLGKARQGRQR